MEFVAVERPDGESSSSGDFGNQVSANEPWHADREALRANDGNDGDVSIESRSVRSRYRSYPALEGGWGWAVVLSGFVLHVLTRGCLFSTGVLFSEWISFFGKSKRDTALVGSIATGSALMLGPLASRFVERWGYRTTAMVGGAISTVGFITSYWANGVYYLYLTYGLLAGTGMGVSYLCGVIAVGEYFDERRSLAFGISAAGAGCGASAMAVLQRILLEQYGWKGTMIILAGLSGLNQIAFGAFLRPLSSSLNWKSKAGKKRLLNHRLDCSMTDDSAEVSGSTKRESQVSEIGSLEAINVRISFYSDDVGFKEEYDPPTERCEEKLDTLALPAQPRERTLSDTYPHLEKPLSPCLMLRRKLKQAHGSNPASPSFLPTLKDARSNYKLFDSEENLCESAQTIDVVENDHRKCTLRRLKHSSKKITTGDAMYLSSISIASSRAAVDAMLSHNDLCDGASLNGSSDADSSKSSSLESSCQGTSDKDHPLIGDGIHEKRCTPVLKNPLFVILALNQFFTGLGIMVPFVHLAEKAILMGISESYAAYLVAFIGIGNVIGKVLLGYLCDMKWTDIFIVFVITQIGLCVSVMMFPLFTGYAALVLTSLLFGFFYGNYSAIPSLTAEYVGLHNLAEAIGYINFLEGLAGIIGPPLAGAIYDSSMSYNVAFAVAACFLVISSLVLGAQPYFYKRITGRSSSLSKMFARSKYQSKSLQVDDIAKTKNLDHNANCLTDIGVEEKVVMD